MLTGPIGGGGRTWMTQVWVKSCVIVREVGVLE